MSRLGLGTVQFGLPYGVANRTGQVSMADVEAILDRARSNGIDLLDTAIGYGDSESVLGKAGVSDFNIVTKLPRIQPGQVRAEVEGSLSRLGIGRLYAVLLHCPDQLTDPEGDALYAGLRQIKEQGLTERIGISVYAPAELDRLMVRYPLDLVQAPLNILDQRLISSGWARRLKQTGVEIHVRSIFLQGLLLMTPEQRPGKFDRFADYWSRWQEWLRVQSLSPLAACLGYAAGVEDVDRVLFGVDGVAQLDDIVAAARTSLSVLPDWPLPVDEMLVNPGRWAEL